MVPVTVGTVGTVLGIAIPFYLFVPYIPFEFTIGIWILIAGVHNGDGASVEAETPVLLASAQRAS